MSLNASETQYQHHPEFGFGASKDLGLGKEISSK
jgi:hypothetical protein